MKTEAQLPGDPTAAAPHPTSLPLGPASVGPAADYSRESNLALAFLCLPRAKREDMNVFYTFCRVVDDIADSGRFTPEEKTAQFAAWREALTTLASAGEPASASAGATPRLLEQVRTLIARYGLPTEHFLEIIAGCEMDIHPREYATFEDLRVYCHRVASTVGLVSIEIFGYRPEHAEACRRYATDLGMALQLTNIIRDVAKDVRHDGRVYLPAVDLARFGLTAEALRELPPDEAPGTRETLGAELTRGAWSQTEGRLRELLRFEADRAEKFYRTAAEALPPSERRTMVAAEIMRAVYHLLLTKMREDKFRVFATEYRLGKMLRLWTAVTAALGTRRAPTRRPAPPENVRNPGAKRMV